MATKKTRLSRHIGTGQTWQYGFIRIGRGHKKSAHQTTFYAIHLLMQYTYQNPNAFYISVNKGELWIPDEIANRSVGINGDLASVIHDWATR